MIACRRKHLRVISFTFSLAMALLAICPAITGPVSASPTDPDLPEVGEIVGGIENWPIWPAPFASSSDLINEKPPTHLTPVGRDVIAWVDFSIPADQTLLWVEELTVLLSDGTGTIESAKVFGGDDWGYFPPATEGQLTSYPVASLDHYLTDFAVWPEFVDEWFITEVVSSADITYSPNQTFPFTDEWMDFHKDERNKDGHTLADSGHAWPMVVQKSDSWSSLIPGYAPRRESEWETPWLFVSTNDGTLNIFEITDQGSPQANRYHQIVPGAAFPISVYQEHLKQVSGDYPRLTMLDGPIIVRDVEDQDDGSTPWKRVLIGTTGLGVDLEAKEKTAWLKELESEFGSENDRKPTDSAPSISKGHHFAVYALDVSDPDDPEQLWTKENLHWSGSQSSNPADFDMERCVSRPVIGYTLTDFDDTDSSDNRTWHALFVGLDADDNLMWLDLDPLTGEKRDSGTFNTGAGKSPHENLYPSRILAAYPKVAVDNEDYNSPLLSDLYVLLSTGELFFWNLQASEAKDRKPFKLVSFYRPLAETFNHFFDTLTEWGIERPRTQPECPPVSNFDIAYYEGKTYFAATLDTDYLHAREHNSLVILELETLLGNSFRNGTASPVEALMGESLLGNYKTMVPISIRTEGLNGLNDNVIALGLPLKSSSASGQPVSDPLFLQGKLYFAAFPGPDEQTLLYHIPLEDLASIFDEGKNLSNRFGFWDWLFSGNKKDYIRTHLLEPLAEGNDYTLLDSSSERPHLIVDSSGTLIVTESDGDTIASEDVMGNLGEISEAGDVAPEDQMQVVYWKED